MTQEVVAITALDDLLSVCAWCRRVRDDNGEWGGVEPGPQEHCRGHFTHGICPDCAIRVYSTEAERVSPRRMVEKS